MRCGSIGQLARILVTYFDNFWPLRAESVSAILQMASEKAGPSLDGLANAWQALEGPSQTLPDEILRARRGLRGLGVEARRHVEDAVAREDIGHLLHRQHWLLTHWRAESDRLTYRRFFNITGLIGVRVEDHAVFERIHARPLAMVRAGEVDGLRIDHIDGLADPTAYCGQLRRAVKPDTILLIEKILGREEPLRNWPITGTTGYERLNDINGLFVDPDGWRALDGYLVSRGALAAEPEARLAAAKAFVLRTSFVAEVNKLGELALRLAKDDPRAADFGPSTLRDGIVALLIRFPVYRSYGPDTGRIRRIMRLGKRRSVSSLSMTTPGWRRRPGSWWRGWPKRPTRSRRSSFAASSSSAAQPWRKDWRIPSSTAASR